MKARYRVLLVPNKVILLSMFTNKTFKHWLTKTPMIT